MMMKNTRIATRIAAGFGLILLMLAVLAGGDAHARQQRTAARV